MSECQDCNGSGVRVVEGRRQLCPCCPRYDGPPASGSAPQKRVRKASAVESAEYRYRRRADRRN